MTDFGYTMLNFLNLSATYGISPESRDQFEKMVSNFQNTDKEIQSWNLRKSPFKLKHNFFSVLDDIEF
jgi:hypothetical protein